MKKLTCFAILLLATKLFAQPGPATKEDVDVYFEILVSTYNALMKDTSGILGQYYDRKDFFEYRKKDVLKDSVLVKSYLLRSTKRSVREITRKYATLRHIFLRSEINGRAVDKISKLQEGIRKLYDTTELKSLQEILHVSIKFKLSFQIVDSINVVIPGAGCYLLSKSKCRDILCGSCKKIYRDNCDELFMDKLKQTEFWDPANPGIPVYLSYGTYIYYIVAGGRILKKDFLHVDKTNAAFDTINLRKISVGSND